MFEQSLNSEDGKLETCQSPSHDVHMTAETEVEASVDNAESHGNSICKDNWQGFCLIESEPVCMDRTVSYNFNRLTVMG